MNFINRNLYISGNHSYGKSIINKMIQEIAHTRDKYYPGIFKESDWSITSQDISISVRIKELNNSNLLQIANKSINDENIIIYIADLAERRTKKILIEEIEILKRLSEISTVIVIVPYESGQKFEADKIKKEISFIEYFIPIYYPSLHHETDILNEFGTLLRQIIINTHPYSSNFAEYLINDNYLTKDPVLDLGNCGITSFKKIKSLFKNTHLKKLILSNEWGEFEGESILRRTSKNNNEPNILFEIPKDIEALKNLEILIAGGNWTNSKRRKNSYFSRWYICDIEALSRLKKIQILNISNNEIVNIDPISVLSNLNKLYVNNNFIKSFPSIVNFPKLQVLYLSNNQLGSVEFLSKNSQLKLVDLHSNQITDLTPIIELIKRIDITDSKWDFNTISIANNPLSVPPAEVVSKGKNNVLAYFEQLEAEQDIHINPFINSDIKLILVGNSNVGKSTYVNWLMTDKINKNISTTHWLEYKIAKIKGNKKEYTVRIFDFGGQEYYHDTHHLFFTNRTAYVLIWDKFSNHFGEIMVNQTQVDGKKEDVKIESFPLQYWLDSIRYHTNKKRLSQIEESITKILDERDKQIENSIKSNLNWLFALNETNIKISDVISEEENILILQNKVDSIRDKIFIDEGKIKEDFPKVYDLEQISIYENNRLKLSKSLILDIFDSMEISNRLFLGTWDIIKQDIEITTFIDSFTIKDFQLYCNGIIRKLPQLNGKTRKQQDKVLFSLSDAKVFASFLSDIGLCLYYPENTKLNEKVFLNHNSILNDINKILRKININTGEISESLIAITLGEPPLSEKIRDIINLMLHFKILFKHPILSENSYIAPLYLPDEPPKSIKLFQDLFEIPVYRFEYESFIHKSVILDFFHEYGSKALSENGDAGSYYYWKNGIVIKSENCNEIVMVKFVPWNDNDKCALLDIFVIKGSDDKFINDIVKYIDSINVGIKVIKLVPNDLRDDFVPLNIIHENEEKQNLVFHYNSKYYKLTSFKKYLNSKLKMKKIFISYSKQDLKLVNKFIEHLSALQKDGKVAHWYCSELEAGSNWNEEIQQHFDESDIACFMVSPNFMKTDYIHEHEIKKAFERKATDPSFKIVPIILNFCRWTTTNNNLGNYTALPYTAKPVMDFNNQDMAWYIIEACLRVMIDNDINPTDESFFSHQALPSDVLKIYERIIAGKVDNNNAS